jgi:TPR repeat protein
VVPQNPQENCAKAIEWYLKADKLGSNEAAGWLGHPYRRLDCPQRDLRVAAQWLRKAVPLATYGAATDLADLYSAADSAERDDTLAYAYARVAAEFEANLSGATPATERVAILGQPLDTRQRKSGDELAEKLLADVRQRRAAMTAAPREEKL